MIGRVLVLGLITVIAVSSSVALQEPTEDAELTAGIRQARRGDFENAVITLDGVVQRLGAEGGRPKELSRAYVYLGISYLGLSQEQKAKAQFLEAWKSDRELSLTEEEFPPRILQFFEETRREAQAEAAAKETREELAPPPTATEPQSEPSETPTQGQVSSATPVTQESKKEGGSKTLLILGGVAAAGVAVAVALGGGDDGGGGGGGGGGSDDVSGSACPSSGTTSPTPELSAAPLYAGVDTMYTFSNVARAASNVDLVITSQSDLNDQNEFISVYLADTLFVGNVFRSSDEFPNCATRVARLPVAADTFNTALNGTTLSVRLQASPELSDGCTFPTTVSIASYACTR